MQAFKRIVFVLILAAIIVVPLALGFGLFLGNKKTSNVTEISTQESTDQSLATSQSATINSSKSTESSESDPKTASQTPAKVSQNVKDMLATMTLSEKVGQLFLARVPAENQISDLDTYALGGYLLFGRDVEGVTAAELTEKIASYKDASRYPLLIAADEEGGTVSRISRNSLLVDPPFESPQSLYQQGGWQKITDDTIAKAKILHSYGIDTGLFPIADVATDPKAFIYDRTIGMDADQTATYVKKVVKALKEAKSGSTLKHFPGYGNNADSHTEIVTDTRSLSELENNDFKPFAAGIEAGVDSILVSHNIVNAIDSSQPASISPAVHQVLRKDLGFEGVIMTDDMDMAGLANFISQEEAGLKALQAGNDLVLSSTYSIQIPRVITAVKEGEYPEADLDQAVMRILQWKENLGLLG